MRLLTPSGARSFCQSFTGSPDTQDIDVGKHLDTFRTVRLFHEGTPEFEALRDCLLRDAERQTFLAAANFATAHRGLQAGSMSWTLVGLYYSAYFAARAILSMHGGWVDANRRWLGLTNLSPGSFEFTYSRSAHSAIPKGWGTHKAFWSVFYHAVPTLQAHAPVAHAFSLSPVQSSNTWLISNRNEMNYNSATSIKATNEFVARYDPTSIPACLPGDLKVYKNISSSLLAVVSHFRTSYGLQSDVQIGGHSNIGDAIEILLKRDAPPELIAYCRQTITEFAA